MKTVFKQFIMLALAGSIVSCGNTTAPTPKSESKIKQANWLMGAWQNNMPEGNLTETWTLQNDSVLLGTTFFVAGKDTTFSEITSIAQEGNELFYIPTIKDQNNGLPVKFKLTASNDTQLVFENPEHDFPQKITYTHVKNDSLVAEISGLSKGEPHSEQFPMLRVK